MQEGGGGGRNNRGGGAKRQTGIAKFEKQLKSGVSQILGGQSRDSVPSRAGGGGGGGPKIKGFVGGGS